MRIGILSAELGQEDVHENKRLAREIWLKGHRAQVINYRKTVVVTAKNKRLLYQSGKNGTLHLVRVNAVIPRINEADEQSINLAALALEILISNGVYSTATPAGIRLAKNKIHSLIALTEAGIPSPRSAAITGTELYDSDADKLLKIVEPNLGKRLIVKTNTGTHGKGVMSANSRGEARAIVDGFLANNIPILLQQFVEPTKKDRYVDLRFIVVNGRVVGAMKRMSSRKDEIRANISLGGIGLPHEPTETEVALAEAAAKAVGLTVAGVDIIPSGKRRMVIEVNTSPGFAIEDISGVNIAKKIVQQAVSHAKRNPKSTKLAERLGVDKLVPSRLNPVGQFPLLSTNIKSFKKLKKIAQRP